MYCFVSVPFVLRIIQGPGEGEELSFEGSARLGRTADNDLVIRDPSSSRSHAQVSSRESHFFIEDLQSANGTQLNDAPIEEPVELHNGDHITIGDVTLEFTVAEPLVPADDPSATTSDEAPPPPPKTSPPGRATLRRPPVRRAPAPEPEAEAPEEEPEELDASRTEADHEDEPDPAIEVHTLRPPSRRSGAVAPARASRPDRAPEVMSAAERARMRRELQGSVAGRFQLVWLSLNAPARIAVSMLLAGLVVGAMVGLVILAFPRKAKVLIEPVELVPNADPVTSSFGLGDGVTFERRDLKAFEFSFAAATRVVGVLHYQAKWIAKGEVTVELNGIELGQVPPDVLDTDSRELDLVLASRLVKVGEQTRNQLVFDSTVNPPGNESWKIWNIWVELIPIPEMAPEDAWARARDDMQTAAYFWEARDIGAINLFRAWKTYRDAWLLLEATPNPPQALLDNARTRMKEIRPELDRRCSAKLVDFKQVMQSKNPDLVRARKVLEDIPNSFPTREHPCFNLSRALVRDLEEVSEIP